MNVKMAQYKLLNVDKIEKKYLKKQSDRDLWKNNKRSNTYAIKVPEGEKKRLWERWKIEEVK